MGFTADDVNCMFELAVVELATALIDEGGVGAPLGLNPGGVGAPPFVSPASAGRGGVDAPPGVAPRMVSTSCNLISPAKPSEKPSSSSRILVSSITKRGRPDHLHAIPMS